MDERYREHTNPTTDGAGAGYKVEKVPCPSLSGTCFTNMQKVDDLQASVAMNPQAAFHNRMTKRIIAMGKVRDTQRRQEEEFEGQTVEILPPIKVKKPIVTVRAQRSFSRGMEVRDIKAGRKGIIIQASVGYTKKYHTPVHRLCDSRGNAWLARENDLKPV